MKFRLRTLDELEIEDEESFKHIGLYADLKEVLRRDAVKFRVLPDGEPKWGRAQVLNLTLWAGDAGGDVLIDEQVPADVVTHVAWHHLAARALGTPPSMEALFLGEAIASAFDLFLVGRLLGHAPDSAFLETQVPAMAETAADAGLSDNAFETLIDGIAADPDTAFEDLRALLFDATRGLAACDDASQALEVLTNLEGRRFEPLLHRFELSNWVLHALVHAGRAAPDPRVRAVDEALRAAPGKALDWLTDAWVLPALR